MGQEWSYLGPECQGSLSWLMPDSVPTPGCAALAGLLAECECSLSPQGCLVIPVSGSALGAATHEDLFTALKGNPSR